MVRLPDINQWDRGTIPLEKRGLIWYMDGSKINEGTGTGMYDCGMKQKFSFSLGLYAIVFQAKVYAIKACAEENNRRIIGTSIFSETVKVQLEHSTIVR
jgi:hypothetical protein